ncbi:hypothetical protein ACLKA7_007295 [Drosophila subpalustris]
MLTLLQFCCLWSDVGFCFGPRPLKQLELEPNRHSILRAGARVVPLTRQPTANLESNGSMDDLGSILDMSLDFNPYDVRFSVQLCNDAS